MDRVVALGDHVADMSDALQAVALEVGAAGESLHELVLEGVGDDATTDALTGAITRLEQMLRTVAQESADAAQAVRRHVGEQPT